MHARICSKFEDFKNKSRTLVSKLKLQGYRDSDLKRLTLRFFKDRQELLNKYCINDANIFLRSIVCL